MNRRVVVTGVGVVSSLGVGAAAHLGGMREGRSGIGEMKRMNTEGLSITIGGEADAFDGAEHFSRQEVTLKDRVTQMGTIAAREAIETSGFKPSEEVALKTAVVLGSSMGGMETLDGNYLRVYQEGKTRIHPFTVPRLMANAAASHISMDHGYKGPAWVITTACASSNHAIGQAFHLVRSGSAEAAVTGGCESGLTYGVIKAWEGLRVMSKDACRPFCRTRNGMVQGEGSAIYVLETLDHALERGAPILFELVGFGMTADAGDIVQPSQDGAARAMRAAIEDSGLAPEQFGYINAHGTATAANDKTECASIREVFGRHADDLLVSSTKSMHGHAIGAAGALELAAVLLALRDGVAPPTINFQERDPECDLDIVPNEAREAKIEAAMSNSFAFGGLNAVVAAKAWRGA